MEMLNKNQISRTGWVYNWKKKVVTQKYKFEQQLNIKWGKFRRSETIWNSS